MKNLFYRIFNIKFAVKVILSIFFAISLRLFYLEVLGLNLSLDIIDFNSISFYSIVTLFRCILSALVDEWYLKPLPMGTNEITNLINKPALSMDDASQNLSGSSSSDMFTHEQYLIGKDMSKTLQSMWYTLGDIQKIKESHNINLFVSKNDSLSIDVPYNMSDKKAGEINQKVLTLDRAYNNHLDHYKELLAKDRSYNNRGVTKSYSNLYKLVADRHKGVYTND